jgi:hypothetical protein
MNLVTNRDDDYGFIVDTLTWVPNWKRTAVDTGRNNGATEIRRSIEPGGFIKNANSRRREKEEGTWFFTVGKRSGL